MVDISFSFSGKCWHWKSEGATWFFITLPHDKSEEIKFFNTNLRHKKRGWGAMRVQVKVGKTVWVTSIFPHKASDAYILPVKASVRKDENITAGSEVFVTLKMDV